MSDVVTTPIVIGHRGAKAVAPENTLASFESACRSGSVMLELDVQLTADGVVVVVHDDTVDRCSDGSGAVREKTLEELRALDAGTWFSPVYAGQRIPTFAELLELMQRHPSVGLLVEFKDVWTAEEVALVTSAIDAAGMGERSIVQSFYPETVAALREAAPHLRRGWLIWELHEPLLDICAQLDVMTCNPSVELVLADPDLVARIHSAGLQAMVYTANEPAQWEGLVAAGVDAIITDCPDRLTGWLAARAG